MNIFSFFTKWRCNRKKLENKLDLIISQNNLILNKGMDISVIPNGESVQIKEDKISIDKFSLKNEQSEEIIRFDLASNKILDENWKQIPIDNSNKENMKGFLSNLLGGSSNVGIVYTATKGLFKATTDPSTLMKLSSGGVGSAVIVNGKISAQAGFIAAGSSIFTPLLIFQFASIVTGQYYMNNITKQLNSIQEKLDELIALFHIERQAKLKKSVIVLTDFINRRNFVIEDFVLIKLIISELYDIREEYFIMISNSIDVIKRNNKYSEFNSLSEAEKIINDFKKEGFFQKLTTSITADELYLFANIVELHMNLSYKNPDINRLSLIQDKVNTISKLDIDSIQLNKTKGIYVEIKEDIMKSINNSINSSWLKKDKIRDLKNTLHSDFNNFEIEREKKLATIQTNSRSITQLFDKEQEVLIDNSGDEPVLYIK
jgi:hypothetical protein